MNTCSFSCICRAFEAGLRYLEPTSGKAAPRSNSSRLPGVPRDHRRLSSAHGRDPGCAAGGIYPVAGA